MGLEPGTTGTLPNYPNDPPKIIKVGSSLSSEACSQLAKPEEQIAKSLIVVLLLLQLGGGAESAQDTAVAGQKLSWALLLLCPTDMDIEKSHGHLRSHKHF